MANQKVWIPEITDKELKRRARRIKPTVRFGKGTRERLRYIKPVNLRNVAYTWDPKPAEVAKGLSPLRVITTYHGYGAPSFFKPSVAEVLAAIPDDIIDQVVAFEIIKCPETVDDLNREPEALNAGYHVAITRLYGRQ